ncbi:hypothetical protein D1101_09550 [Actinobacillus pleuropneumoniae serovar 8 str. 405]|nr:hypothetical protein D1101_09550 [Actinobacillus pleuropneumoniae serovar 8 str. 405]
MKELSVKDYELVSGGGGLLLCGLELELQLMLVVKCIVGKKLLRLVLCLLLWEAVLAELQPM